MRFGHIEILANDVGKSVAFYKDILEFDVTIAQGPDFVWLQKGELEILIRPGGVRKMAKRYEDAPTGFVIYTEDVLAKKKELEERGLIFKGTADSAHCFTFTDPDGNWFQLVDPEDH